MAELSDSGTYIKFEVNAWIDGGVVRLTANDRELRDLGGVHVRVRRGSETENHIRSLMRSKGIDVPE